MAELPVGVSWTQDEDSVEVTVVVAPETTPDLVQVKTTAENLTVHVREFDQWKPVVTGTLRQNVERQSCCWALEKHGSGKAIVIQLEKKNCQPWDALLRANVSGSILEELGREQVIVDAGADAAVSSVCGRCGALVKASRMDAHAKLWCPALQSDGTALDEED